MDTFLLAVMLLNNCAGVQWYQGNRSLAAQHLRRCLQLLERAETDVQLVLLRALVQRNLALLTTADGCLPSVHLYQAAADDLEIAARAERVDSHWSDLANRLTIAVQRDLARAQLAHNQTTAAIGTLEKAIRSCLDGWDCRTADIPDVPAQYHVPQDYRRAGLLEVLCNLRTAMSGSATQGSLIRQLDRAVNQLWDLPDGGGREGMSEFSRLADLLLSSRRPEVQQDARYYHYTVPGHFVWIAPHVSDSESVSPRTGLLDHDWIGSSQDPVFHHRPRGLEFPRWLRCRSDQRGGIDVLLQVVTTLESWRSERIIHEAPAPKKVIVDGDGRALIMDFGTSRLKNGQDRTLDIHSPDLHSIAAFIVPLIDCTFDLSLGDNTTTSSLNEQQQIRHRLQRCAARCNNLELDHYRSPRELLNDLLELQEQLHPSRCGEASGLESELESDTSSHPNDREGRLQPGEACPSLLAVANYAFLPECDPIAPVILSSREKELIQQHLRRECEFCRQWYETALRRSQPAAQLDSTSNAPWKGYQHNLQLAIGPEGVSSSVLSTNTNEAGCSQTDAIIENSLKSDLLSNPKLAAAYGGLHSLSLYDQSLHHTTQSEQHGERKPGRSSSEESPDPPQERAGDDDDEPLD